MALRTTTVPRTSQSEAAHNASYGRIIASSVQTLALSLGGASVSTLPAAQLVAGYTITRPGFYSLGANVAATSAAPLIIASDNVTVFGNGYVINLAAAPAGAVGVTVNTHTNVHLYIGVTGKAGQGDRGIKLTNARDVTISNARFVNLQSAIELDGACVDCHEFELDSQDCEHTVRVLSTGSCTNCVTASCSGTWSLAGQKKWFYSNEGVCNNCFVEYNQLSDLKIYTRQGKNCSILGNQQTVTSNISVNGDAAIISGGLKDPTPPSAPPPVPFPPVPDQVGCSNCDISKNQVFWPCNGGLVFVGGIVSLFSDSCRLAQNEINVPEPTFTSLAVCIASSYCLQCQHDKNICSGCLLGEFICDVYDQNVFCKGTQVRRTIVHNCANGICLLRCEGPSALECQVTGCSYGIVVSEGAMNTTVQDCAVKNCTTAGLYNGVAPPPFPDIYLAVPVNTNLINNTFNGTVGGIVAPTPVVLTGFNVVN